MESRGRIQLKWHGDADILAARVEGKWVGRATLASATSFSRSVSLLFERGEEKEEEDRDSETVMSRKCNYTQIKSHVAH